MSVSSSERKHINYVKQIFFGSLFECLTKMNRLGFGCVGEVMPSCTSWKAVKLRLNYLPDFTVSSWGCNHVQQMAPHEEIRGKSIVFVRQIVLSVLILLRFLYERERVARLTQLFVGCSRLKSLINVTPGRWQLILLFIYKYTRSRPTHSSNFLVLMKQKWRRLQKAS